VRVRDAPALARTAIVTGETAVVILRQDGGAADRHHTLAAKRLEDLWTRVLLDDRHRHRRQEIAVGELIQVLVRAGHADEPLDMRVPRRDILITNRPVVAVSVLRVGLEIEVAPAVDLTSPRQRSPTHVTTAEPAEGRV